MRNNNQNTPLDTFYRSLDHNSRLSRELIDDKGATVEDYSEIVSELEQTVLKLDKVIAINTYITDSLEKTEVLKRILKQTRDLLECERSSMMLVDKTDSLLKFAVLSKDDESDMLKGIALNRGEGVAGTVWEDGSPIIVNDVDRDSRFSNRVDEHANSVTKSIVAVPLTVDGEIIGVIEGINKRSGSFNEFDLRIMQYISTQSAIAIKNADLYDMAIKDGMTKLFIQKYFRERLMGEFERSKRFNRNLSVVIADIDFFKKFNDNYGHQAGDMVLVKVAECISSRCRAADIPCRYGGEEFAIILPETDIDSALIFAERLRGEISRISVDYGEVCLGLTISVGVASYPDSNPSDSIELIELADRALYQSKNSGRNKVTKL